MWEHRLKVRQELHIATGQDVGRVLRELKRKTRKNKDQTSLTGGSKDNVGRDVLRGAVSLAPISCLAPSFGNRIRFEKEIGISTSLWFMHMILDQATSV